MSESHKQLFMQLADGQFHSGTALAKSLGISRSAVWKQVQALSAYGIEIAAVSGKGYKLPLALEPLAAAKIFSHLNAECLALITNMEIHDSISSTNEYLLQLSRQTDYSGIVCLAEFQSAGKGRRGRQWVSPYGQNIYLSLLWHYQEGPAALSGLSLALGVAVMKALAPLGIKDLGLKWPNDIIRNQQKLGGILVEISGETGGPCHAVIGLGLNFYLSNQQAETISQPWTDLSTALGSVVYSRRNEVVGLLLNQLLPLIANFTHLDNQDYLTEWRNYDVMCGKTTTIFFGEHSHTGCILGINDEGLLMMQCTDGQLRHFASGEVSFSAL